MTRPRQVLSSGKYRTVGRSERTADVLAKLSELKGMTHTALKAVWAEMFGTSAPRNLSRRLLVHALAYEVQVRAHRGLTEALRKQLHHIARTTESASEAGGKPTPVMFSPGTRLMREWRGTVHVVDVSADGFIWNGRAHQSLSAIARAITGTRWNGLAFFGLRKRNPA